MLKDHLNKLKKIEPKRLLIYIILYFGWGYAMNMVGKELEIAQFTYWWQIISCYILYMVPISIMLRGYSFFTQYAYGLVAMGLLEFGGYALETSYAYPNNLLDQFFGIRNFSLAMALFFGLYFPIGNAVVDAIYGWVNRSKQS
jgi:hypothetical protein